MNTMPDIFDYTVHDRDNEKAGTVEAVWKDDEGSVRFIGVATGWLGFGLNHIIPVAGMTVNTEDETIRVPFGEDVIKTSTSYGNDMDLTDEQEIELYRHYGVEGRPAVSLKIIAEPEFAGR